MKSLDAQATQPVGDTATPETTDREQTIEITLGPMSVRSGDCSSLWVPQGYVAYCVQKLLSRKSGHGTRLLVEVDLLTKE